MADQLQLRGGTTAENDAFTGVSREVTIDTEKNTVVVHDGFTEGGHPLLREADTATLLARANHTGTQTMSTISDAGTAATQDITETATDTTAGRLLKVGDNVERVVDTISDLIGTSEQTVKSVRVLNYHSDVEGGGGVFYWDATKAKSEHNGGTVIDPTAVYPTDWSNQTQLGTWFDTANAGTGCWVRQYDGLEVDPIMFGAKADGVADDTLALLSARLFAISPQGPKGLKFSTNKQYRYTQTLFLTGGLRYLKGEAADFAGITDTIPTLLYDGAVDTWAISSSTNPASPTKQEGGVSHGSISNIRVVGASAGVANGVDLHRFRNGAQIKSFSVKDFKIGVRTSFQWSNNFENWYITDCDTGWYHHLNDLNSITATNITILQCGIGIDFSRDSNIRYFSGTGFNIENNTIGVKLGQNNVSSTGYFPLMISGYFESNNVHIQVEELSDTVSSLVDFSGSYFFFGSSSTQKLIEYIGLSGQRKNTLKFTNCTFTHAPQDWVSFSGISASDAVRLIFENNNFIFSTGLPKTPEVWKRNSLGRDLYSEIVLSSGVVGSLQAWRSLDGVANVRGELTGLPSGSVPELWGGFNKGVFPGWFGSDNNFIPVGITGTSLTAIPGRSGVGFSLLQIQPTGGAFLQRGSMSISKVFINAKY